MQSTAKSLITLIQTISHLHITGSVSRLIQHITADSRLVQPGSLFVAYKGVEVDGHSFISAAIQRGAVALVIEDDYPHPLQATGLTILRVPDGREALAHLMAAWHNYPSRHLTVIGITGTDGKTSTINLIFSILKQAGYRVGMISTVNAIIGDDVQETGLHTTTPDATDLQDYLARMVEANLDICLLETTSHGLAQHRVTATEFDFAVVTNITHEHLDIHGSLDAYRLAKARLFQLAQKGVVLNADDWSYQFLRDKIDPALPVISYGLEASATLQASHITLKPDTTRFETVLAEQSWLVKTPLVGAFNISNILAALAVTVGFLQVDPAVALTALHQFKGVPGRMERLSQTEPFTAIVDFAHTPNALRRALETVRTLTSERVIAIFGCAGLRDIDKRTMMGHIAADLAHLTIITAEDPRTENLDTIIDTTAQAMHQRGAIEISFNPNDFQSMQTQLNQTSVPAFIRLPDRGYAIYLGTQLAQPGDIVIALGKGHEQSMCFGQTEYPWDDREAMRTALIGSPHLTLPTGADFAFFVDG